MNDTKMATRNGAGVRATWALALCTFILVSAASARQPSSGSAADLDGRWYHDGKSTRILVAPDGRSITIINELGQRNDGYASDSRNLVIPSLGITGRVSKNGRRITWTNGTEWTRDSRDSGSGVAVGLDGRWFHDGKPTAIAVAPDGRNLTIINEVGQRSSGYAASRHELVIPSLDLRGRVTHGEKRISWSNGTEWRR